MDDIAFLLICVAFSWSRVERLFLAVTAAPCVIMLSAARKASRSIRVWGRVGSLGRQGGVYRVMAERDEGGGVVGEFVAV
jgi:hypothetical protein